MIKRFVRSKRFFTRSHQEWHEVGGCRKFFRSRWEWKYAEYLEKLKQLGEIKSWEHEPKTFWFEAIKRGVRSYKPDFLVTNPDGSHYWVEVKGYYDSKSLTKLKRFKKYFPKEEIHTVDGDWFKENGII